MLIEKEYKTACEKLEPQQQKRKKLEAQQQKLEPLQQNDMGASVAYRKLAAGITTETISSTASYQ